MSLLITPAAAAARVVASPAVAIVASVIFAEVAAVGGIVLSLAPGVPVVMITTEGNETFVLSAIAAGAQGYICKPFTAEQVKARVLPFRS